MSDSGVNSPRGENVTVFLWGNNNEGQLGLGTSVKEAIVFPPAVCKALLPYRIVKISLGWRHAAAVTDEGKLFVWGYAKDGRLGLGDDLETSYVRTPVLNSNQQISSLRVKTVSCGDLHTCMLSEDGRVYTWGSGNHCQLGHGDRRGLSAPRQVDALSGLTVCDVSCGFYHTAAVTLTGAMYTWGAGDHGKLGHNNTLDLPLPTYVEGLKGLAVKKVSCGGEHTVALLGSCDVYTWGHGQRGRLGLGVAFVRPAGKHGRRAALTYSRDKDPTRIFAESVNKRYDENSTQPHLLVYSDGTDNPEVMDVDDKWEPAALEYLWKKNVLIVQVCAGWSHTLALDKQGCVWAWGEGSGGKLGFGDTRDVYAPCRIDPEIFNGCRVNHISCGWGHSAAITEDGELYTWGVGASGQLGLFERYPNGAYYRPKEILKPTRVPWSEGHSIYGVSCGGAFTAALVEKYPVELLLHRVERLTCEPVEKMSSPELLLELRDLAVSMREQLDGMRHRSTREAEKVRLAKKRVQQAELEMETQRRQIALESGSTRPDDASYMPPQIKKQIMEKDRLIAEQKRVIAAMVHRHTAIVDEMTSLRSDIDRERSQLLTTEKELRTEGEMTTIQLEGEKRKLEEHYRLKFAKLQSELANQKEKNLDLLLMQRQYEDEIGKLRKVCVEYEAERNDRAQGKVSKTIVEELQETLAKEVAMRMKAEEERDAAKEKIKAIHEREAALAKRQFLAQAKAAKNDISAALNPYSAWRESAPMRPSSPQKEQAFADMIEATPNPCYRGGRWLRARPKTARPETKEKTIRAHFPIPSPKSSRK
eukprot:Rmarinus@m.24917